MLFSQAIYCTDEICSKYTGAYALTNVEYNGKLRTAINVMATKTQAENMAREIRDYLNETVVVKFPSDNVANIIIVERGV